MRPISFVVLAVCLSQLAGCSGDGGDNDDPSSPIPAHSVAPFVSAHRGGAAYAPEDTMTAYRNAARLGVDDFETDTVPTRDGVLVLIHDDSVDRTTNCQGKVNSLSFAEIRQCDAGYWWTPGQGTTSPVTDAPHPFRGKGVVIPAAQELFDYAKSLSYGPTVTIEIKNGPTEAQFELRCETTATQLVKMIQDSGIKDRIVVQSFDPSCIGNVKSKDPAIRTLYLSSLSAYANLAYCEARGHEFASPSFTAPDFNATFVGAAHAAGVKTNPYTVDSKADLQSVMATGTDGIITNFPACLLQMQGRQLPESVVAPLAQLDESGFDRCGS